MKRSGRMAREWRIEKQKVGRREGRFDRSDEEIKTLGKRENNQRASIISESLVASLDRIRIGEEIARLINEKKQRETGYFID